MASPVPGVAVRRPAIDTGFTGKCVWICRESSNHLQRDSRRSV